MIISASTTYVTLCDIIRSFMTTDYFISSGYKPVISLSACMLPVCTAYVRRVSCVFCCVYTMCPCVHPVSYAARVYSVCTSPCLLRCACVQRLYAVCTSYVQHVYTTPSCTSPVCVQRVYSVCTACVHVACPLLPVAEHWWRGTHGSGGPRWSSRADFSPLSPSPLSALSSRPSVLSSVCLLVSSVLCPVICPLCPIFTSPHPSQSSRLNHPLAVHLLHPPPSSVVIPLPPSFFLFIPLSLSPLFLCLPPSFFSSSLFFLLHPSSSILLHLSSSLFLDPPSLSSLLSSLFLLPPLNPRPCPVDRSLWRLYRWEWGPGLR